MSTISNPIVSAMSAIEVQNLTKIFDLKQGRHLKALDNISFCVPEGGVFAILGPNGAGKTTLLRILTTLLRPDSGSVTILGRNILSDVLEVRKSIGIVAQDNHFDRYLTIWHNLTLHAQMHGLSKPEYEARITELLNQVELYDRRTDYMDQLSGGQKRRIALIRALIHSPKLLFLDEPTTGLDPHARRELWQTIEQFKQHATVILTTHYMEEADVLSDQIMILNQGKIVMSGTPSELKKAISPKHTFDFYFHEGKAAHYFELLSQKGFGNIHCGARNHFQITLEPTQTLKDVLDLISWEDISKVGETEADLETVYLTFSNQLGSQSGSNQTNKSEPVLTGDSH